MKTFNDQHKSIFKITTNPVETSPGSNSDSYRIRGIASGSSLDAEGDCMSLDALRYMEDQIIGLTLHKDHVFKIDNTLGHFVDARISINPDGNISELWVEAELEPFSINPDARLVYEKIKSGTRLGFSIAGILKNWEKLDTSEHDYPRYLITDIELLSVDLVTIPAYRPSHGSISIQSDALNDSAPNDNKQASALPDTSTKTSFPQTIGSIACPENYTRISIEDNSFAGYVRALPLKPEGSGVLSHDGSIVHDASEITAVIDWKAPSKVQQCADVAIRLHAEYLRSAGKIESIEYKTLNGTAIGYTKWRHGKYRLNAAGGISYEASPSIRPDTDDEFEKYLQFVFTYANSSSLARDLSGVDARGLRPGDLYIQPDASGRGGIGHVSVLLDICEDSDSDQLYLFGYGFIPAQDFHLPKPSPDQGIGAWFTLEGFKEYVSVFGSGEFYRF